MVPHPPQLAKRIAFATALAAVATMLVMAMPVSATSDNQGTIKVHEAGSLGSTSDNPHVVCSFYVEGFNMEATSGSLVIDQQMPTGTANVVTTTWVANDVVGDGFPDHHFLNGPFNLASGHYKVFVSDTHHDKMKVFWVDPCESSSSSTTSTSQTTTSTSDTTTSTSETTTSTSDTTTSTSDTTTTTSETETTTNEIPFFPSGPSMGLGSLGAAVAGLLMLRRRL